MPDKTELQRQILLTAYDNPGMTQAEIARRLDCSSSYVSEILSRYDGQDAMEARIEELNTQLGIESTGGVFTSDTVLASSADSIDSDIPEIEGSVEDIGPLGALLLSVVIGGYLLLANPLSQSFSQIRWGIILVCGLVVAAVVFYLYNIYQKEGLGAAISTAIGDRQNGDESSPNEASEDTTKTPPAPKSLREDLYFDRAEQECEWCENHIDNPEVHHIEPRSEGGPNTPKNLIVLCPNCHRKADRGGISRTKLKSKVRRQMN